jgi:hypothetical protein
MKYGRLEVQKEIEHKNKCQMVLCRCECGNKKEIQLNNLRSGHTKSCGCIWEEQKHKPRFIKHGMYSTPTYKTWRSMLNRCKYTCVRGSGRYLGRNIKVCSSWNEFKVFLLDMGERPEGKTLDRINNNGNYCKENCRWSTPKEQSNNKENTIFITYNNITKTINEWSKELGVPRATIYSRKKESGWNDNDCLFGRPI